MSLHVVNPELETQLAAQRRNSTIASIIVGILLMVLIALIFYFISIQIFSQKTEPIVSYADEVVADEVLEKVKITNDVKKTPSSPSSSATPIITASATSSFSVPTPEVATENMSVDFGENEGFGDGWGGAGSGFGSGGGSGAFSFMGSKMSGERICFVIDYSGSMAGKRIELLKKELTKTVESLPDRLEYQMIFFAGPAWVAGSKISNPNSTSTSVISYKGKDYKWAGEGYLNWKPVGKRQEVDWMKMSRNNRKQTLDAIQNTVLVAGTTWLTPLEMALDMKPKPELVVFLTDGLSGNKSAETAEKMGDKAKSLGIRINTISLMEPRARLAMADLALRAKGEFSLIGADGKKVKQDIGAGGIKKRK